MSEEINGAVKGMVSMHTHGQLFILPYNFKRRTYPEDYEDMEKVARRAAAAIYNYKDTEYKVGTAADLMGKFIYFFCFFLCLINCHSSANSLFVITLFFRHRSSIIILLFFM